MARYPAHTLTKAATQAGVLLGFDQAGLDRVLMSTEPLCPDPAGEPRLLLPTQAEWRRAVLLVRLYRALVSTGGNDFVRTWMARHNAALGARPADLAQTEAGLEYVVRYLEHHLQR